MENKYVELAWNITIKLNPWGASPELGVVGIDSEVIGKAPNGETMYRWTESDGTEWEEFWQPVPGGGIVQHRKMN